MTLYINFLQRYQNQTFSYLRRGKGVHGHEEMDQDPIRCFKRRCQQARDFKARGYPLGSFIDRIKLTICNHIKF